MKSFAHRVAIAGLFIGIAMTALAGLGLFYWFNYAPSQFPATVINYSPWLRPVLVAACNPGFQVNLKELSIRFPRGMAVIQEIVHNTAESKELKGMAGIAAFFYPGEKAADVILDLVEQENESTLRLLQENFKSIRFTQAQEVRLRRWLKGQRQKEQEKREASAVLSPRSRSIELLIPGDEGWDDGVSREAIKDDSPPVLWTPR